MHRLAEVFVPPKEKTEMGLTRAPLDKALRVTCVRSGGAFGRRLMEMGLIEGAVLAVLRRAPLGDPLHIRLGDYELSLRGREAELIDVSPL
jgi:ferrous iron transport protein A